MNEEQNGVDFFIEKLRTEADNQHNHPVASLLREAAEVIKAYQEGTERNHTKIVEIAKRLGVEGA